MEKTTREIYFSEIYDENIFNKISVNYKLFDRNSIKIKNTDKISAFLINAEIIERLSNLLLNNSYPIVYILYTSNADSVRESIIANCKLPDNYQIDFNLILETDNKEYSDNYKSVIIK